MKRLALMWIVFTGALLAPATGYAQISCSRDGLQRAIDLYIAAQTKGDVSGLPLATGLGYTENMARADINTGLIKTAMTIDHHRSLIDPSTCQTFTAARYARYAGRRRQRVPRCVSRGEEGPGAVGLPLPTHGRRNAHRQRSP
jgi:hypothetical protein